MHLVARYLVNSFVQFMLDVVQTHDKKKLYLSGLLEESMGIAFIYVFGFEYYVYG